MSYPYSEQDRMPPQGLAHNVARSLGAFPEFVAKPHGTLTTVDICLGSLPEPEGRPNVQRAIATWNNVRLDATWASSSSYGVIWRKALLQSVVIPILKGSIS